MASAVPQKRMVSSVFITLASPFKATVTPTTHIHSNQNTQQSVAPIRKSSSSTGPLDERSPVRINPSPVMSPLYAQSRTPTQTTPTTAQIQTTPTSAPYRDKQHTTKNRSDVFSYPSANLDDTGCTLPPPPRDLRKPNRSESAPPVAPEESLMTASSAGNDQNISSSGSSQVIDVCGFCRKAVLMSDSAIDALNRSYHAACFQCRQCHVPLAAKLYYNKSGIPLCEDCYQASLEPCWACGDVIKDHVIRALERAYHPPCFVCVTCRQPIGEQRFAQGEVGEVYCLQDYYSKYAPQCMSCGELIIPCEDGTDSFTVECLGNSYHEDCYRCEVCNILLSPEPNENGCYPLDGQILCKPCHYKLIHGTQH